MSEIKYPCLMMLSANKKLVVWFTNNQHGIVVQVGGGAELTRFAGEVHDNFADIRWFEPYVRPKEYEYQVTYKVKGLYKISCNFYRNLNLFKKCNISYRDCDMLLFEQSKREVK